MVAVHVLIDLHWQKAVGGHVKSWIQFARAAQKLDVSVLDLTLHFQGDRSEEITKGSNLRFVTHRPRFSTERLPFLQDVPSHTDLSSYAPSLDAYLAQADVVHATHPLFTFGQTALKFCTTTDKPLVSSIHTDSAQYAKIYLEEKLEKIFGKNLLSSFLTKRLNLPERYRQGLDRKQTAYWESCSHVWFSQPSEKVKLQLDNPHISISRLRRGMNQDLFDPSYGDRLQLQAKYGVPTEPFLVLFVGRLDACKNVLTFAEAVKSLIKQGINIHAVAAGHGSQKQNIKDILGDRISLLGNVDHDELGLIYASCDVFVFPSETETVGNVVLEAKASGLVPIVSDQGGVTQLIRESGKDGVIQAGQNPQDWARAVQMLYQNPQKRSQMSQAARQHLRETWPTWDTVLEEDLLPIWQKMI